MKLTDPELARITVNKAKFIFSEMMKHPKMSKHLEHKSCLIWAEAVRQAGEQIGMGLEKMQLQGGSAQWKIVPDELDDGVSANWYSYQYDHKEAPDENGVGVVHYWIVVHPDHDPNKEGLIVDVTVKYIPLLCEEIGVKVKNSFPEYYWMTPKQLKDCNYKPHMQAIINGRMWLLSLLGK